MEVLLPLLLVFAFVSLAWGVLGLIIPKLLFFAHPTKTNRLHAFFFPLSFAIFILFTASFFTPSKATGFFKLVCVALSLTATAQYSFWLSKKSKRKILEESNKIKAHEQAKYQYSERITDYILDEKYSLALKNIQKVLDNPCFDKNDDTYAENVDNCLAELWGEKKPNAILKAYDAMLEKENSPLAYAIQHKETEQTETAFLESLDNYPEIKSPTELKKAVSFLTSEHPLIQGAIQSFEYDFVDFLERACRDIFDDWDNEEEEEPKEYTWEELLQEIDKRL